ncbi:PrpF domain-containing protein [Actinoplanes sp. NBRC 103695]|uniref:PrpF domain-containing protein n=1 Tax=Actinoplanes sp. NBRC 103695 TaxID=3032202 RepID=UPI002553FFF4|nr:PrpF domain-containing protein [Actinoplanes sp. NBRC 103695]
MQMRGGSSKGAYFLAADLPADPAARDDLLLRIMGSPDERQIDGLGGGHPLTSKIAVVSPSDDPEADVDYLFLQVVPGKPMVTDAQTCGNLLAGVGPFAIERGLVHPAGDTTEVRIRILNPTIAFARARVQTPDERVRYDGDTVMAGTPFPAAPIDLTFPGDGTSIFPTGRPSDRFAGLEVTCVNAGMPVVLVRATDLGLRGDESPSTLEEDADLRKRVEKLRLEAGQAMGLGDVTAATVPKISIISAPRGDGTVTTRTFIPHRVHAAIGVLGAVSVAAAIRTPGTNAFASRNEHVRADHPALSNTFVTNNKDDRADHSNRATGTNAPVTHDKHDHSNRTAGTNTFVTHHEHDHPDRTVGTNTFVTHHEHDHPDRTAGTNTFVVDDERVRIEHPTGSFDVAVALEGDRLRESSVVRTARKLSDGLVWPRPGTESP